MKYRIILLLSLLIVGSAVSSMGAEPDSLVVASLRRGVEAPLQQSTDSLVIADCRLSDYLPLLQGKRVGVLTNHTAVVEQTHLVDTLVRCGIDVSVIFAPEHGFRGNYAAGERVSSERDVHTGVEIVSLYGRSFAPRANDVFRCDVIVVDIQDVGLRYYTYLSTLYLMMQTCADVGVPMVLLDRPNPNGMYVDGPILEQEYKSFVGMLPVPVVHGMTLGELARMINGEGWLERGVKCQLTVVPCKGYRRSMRYNLPIAPSPNLPNMKAVYLYPSLCYFEATEVSIGRGTETPFQVVGHPQMDNRGAVFTPTSRPEAKTPPQEGVECYGVDLSRVPDSVVLANRIDLSYLVDAYNQLGAREDFLSPYFEKLIGVGYVREMIISGYTADEIEAVWKSDVDRFCQQRKKYLIYEE